jgi:hypothetical protein
LALQQKRAARRSTISLNAHKQSGRISRKIDAKGVASAAIRRKLPVMSNDRPRLNFSAECRFCGARYEYSTWCPESYQDSSDRVKTCEECTNILDSWPGPELRAYRFVVDPDRRK